MRMMNKLVTAIAVLLLCGCSTTPSQTSPVDVDGQSMWFPLGAAFRICSPGTILNGDAEKTLPAYDRIVPEVYHSNLRHEVQKTTLSVVSDPRWFKGSSPSQSLPALASSDQGASLGFEIHPATNGLLRFVLTLEAQDRNVWREVEHRWTNITPFLFSFFADGKAVRPKGPDSLGKFGGVNSMIMLVEKGKARTWKLTVDSKTILALLSSTGVEELTVVAAFSEYQQTYPGGMFGEDGKPAFSDGFTGPPIVIRSNPVTVTYDGRIWKLANKSVQAAK